MLAVLVRVLLISFYIVVCGLTRLPCVAVLKALQVERISGEDVTKSVFAVAKVAEEEMVRQAPYSYVVRLPACRSGR